MKSRKITIIREMTVGDRVGERRSSIEYDEETGLLICPEKRLNEDQVQHWNDIMDALSKVKVGNQKIDVRSIICGIGLLDFCLNDCIKSKRCKDEEEKEEEEKKNKEKK